MLLENRFVLAKEIFEATGISNASYIVLTKKYKLVPEVDFMKQGATLYIDKFCKKYPYKMGKRISSAKTTDLSNKLLKIHVLKETGATAKMFEKHFAQYLIGKCRVAGKEFYELTPEGVDFFKGKTFYCDTPEEMSSFDSEGLVLSKKKAVVWY